MRHARRPRSRASSRWTSRASVYQAPALALNSAAPAAQAAFRTGFTKAPRCGRTSALGENPPMRASESSSKSSPAKPSESAGRNSRTTRRARIRPAAKVARRSRAIDRPVHGRVAQDPLHVEAGLDVGDLLDELRAVIRPEDVQPVARAPLARVVGREGDVHAPAEARQDAPERPGPEPHRGPGLA